MEDMHDKTSQSCIHEARGPESPQLHYTYLAKRLVHHVDGKDSCKRTRINHSHCYEVSPLHGLLLVAGAARDRGGSDDRAEIRMTSSFWFLVQSAGEALAENYEAATMNQEPETRTRDSEH